MKTLALLGLATVLGFAQAPAKDKKPAPPAKTAEGKPAEAKPADAAILGNKETKTYHKPDCRFGSRMKADKRVSFKTAAEAEKAGYKACKTCNK